MLVSKVRLRNSCICFHLDNVVNIRRVVCGKGLTEVAGVLLESKNSEYLRLPGFEQCVKD